MQRYQTEDEHRKAMRAKINKTIKETEDAGNESSED